MNTSSVTTPLSEKLKIPLFFDRAALYYFYNCGSTQCLRIIYKSVEPYKWQNYCGDYEL